MRPCARQHRSLSPWAAPTILLLASVQLMECTKIVRTKSAICFACMNFVSSASLYLSIFVRFCFWQEFISLSLRDSLYVSVFVSLLARIRFNYLVSASLSLALSVSWQEFVSTWLRHPIFLILLSNFIIVNFNLQYMCLNYCSHIGLKFTKRFHRMSSLWRPLLHDEWFQYGYPYCRILGTDVVALGYVVDMEMILPGHEDCECYWSSHTKRVTWFREADDGRFPAPYTITDQWFTDLKKTGLAQSTLNGMWINKVCGRGISHGSLRKLPRS